MMVHSPLKPIEIQEFQKTTRMKPKNRLFSCHERRKDGTKNVSVLHRSIYMRSFSPINPYFG